MYLYIGPGLGGVGAVILAVFATILSFLVAIFWVPIKKLFKFIFKRKS